MTRFSFVLLFAVCFGSFIGVIFAQEDAVNRGTVRGTITDTTEAQNPIECELPEQIKKDNHAGIQRRLEVSDE